MMQDKEKPNLLVKITVSLNRSEYYHHLIKTIIRNNNIINMQRYIDKTLIKTFMLIFTT